jgi:murein DD-endopeptidase MepM/ murein hydrolase activator NlpD
VRAARFDNDGHTHEAVWFQDGDQRGGYYGPDGQSKARMFLASPLAFSRVTSGFSMRFHPILQQWRAHLGVDYGAPTGTPVRTVGAGTVEFAGVQNGYGNVVIVRHAGDRSTVYAHLSRIAVARGASVSQGDTLGAVGSTGWATGPHLHFEFKFGSRQVDPVKVARGSEAVTLTAEARPRFNAIAATARDQLTAAQALAGAVALME